MLEMFILNPPPKARKSARTRDAPKKRKSKGSKKNKETRMARKKKKKRSKRRMSRNPAVVERVSPFTGAKLVAGYLTPAQQRALGLKKAKPRRKPMAKKRKVARRRRKKRGWHGSRKDHRIAAQIGWAYRRKKRKKGPKSPGRYVLSKVGRRGLRSYRKRRKVSRRRKSKPVYVKWGRQRIAANPPRRRRRRRNQRRDARGRFVSKSGRKRRTTRRRKYAANPPRRRRRSRSRSGYKKNWFVYNRNPKRYMDNPVADIFATIKSTFDIDFLTKTALPVVGGYFGSRAVSAFAIGGVAGAVGIEYSGVVKHVGNFLSAGLLGAGVGYLTKDARLAGNIILGGVVGALAGIITELVGGMDIVQTSPILSSMFMGDMGQVNNDVRKAVEAEVMRELGVSDYLTTQQLSRAENIGDYLTTQQLSRAENISQYPAETSGYLAQYPEETSGGAMADFADVASFG